LRSSYSKGAVAQKIHSSPFQAYAIQENDWIRSRFLFFLVSKCAPDDAAYNYVLSQRRSQLRPKKFNFF
jgi:hypothetical protein